MKRPGMIRALLGDLVAVVALFAVGWAFLVIGHSLGW